MPGVTEPAPSGVAPTHDETSTPAAPSCTLTANLIVAGKPMVVRLLTEDDAPAVLRLHSEVFDSHVQPSWYRWKYKLGTGFAMGLWCEGQLIAHCGGLPRRVMTNASEAAGLQIGDVMVAPAWRGLMTRSSPFFHVSQSLYRTAIGPLCDFSFGFGFPNHRHLRLAVKQQLLQDAGSLWSLCWDWSDPSRQSFESQCRQVQRGNLPASRFWPKFRNWFRPLTNDGPVDISRTLVEDNKTVAAPLGILTPDQRDQMLETCWLNMREGFRTIDSTVLGIRTAAYLKWRFIDHPDHNYQYLVISAPAAAQTPAGCGLVVWRIEGDQATWLDWVGPPSWLPRALAHCAQAAQAAGAKRMTSWMSPCTASFLGEWPEAPPLKPLAETPTRTPDERLSSSHSLQVHGANLSVTEVARIGVPTTSCWPQTSNDGKVNMQGWWMGGDTDFL